MGSIGVNAALFVQELVASFTVSDDNHRVVEDLEREDWAVFDRPLVEPIPSAACLSQKDPAYFFPRPVSGIW